MNRKEIEELKEILEHYCQLIDDAWIDGVDKEWELDKANNLFAKLDKEMR